ncbi:MAG: glycosyltransferase family 2 protein [Solirubrobacterales bacterium]|nr:glycosyltransferase family 2 protein [Solirubrobacterales bacterium]
MPADSTAPRADNGRWSLAFGDAVGDLGLAADELPRAAARPVMLSILMPVYNEERTLRRAVEAVLNQRYPVDIELRVVQDGSTDSTREILDEIQDPRMFVHEHPRNLGKGAAIVFAAMQARGSHIVPFDADLEYSASDLPRMLAPIIAGRCDVVFGTRMFGMYSSYQSYPQAVGNRAMTLATNLLFNCYLSDVHTCLKMMPLELFLSLDLRERGFGLDAELTARLLQRGIRPFEVPVSYHSRSVADGKKITWRDGLHCLRVLGRVRRGQPQCLSDDRGFPAPVATSRRPIHSVSVGRLGQRDTASHVSGAREEDRDATPDVVSAP